MRSIILQRFGGPEVLEVADVPIPEPGTGQVRIRVAASAVNPIDLSLRAGRLSQAGLVASADRFGVGWDVAGHIDARGAGASRFSPGEPVIGLRDLLFAGGAHAEYVVLDEAAVAPAPRSVPLPTAATLPLNGLTAAGALQLAELSPGQTVLVTGVAGGVGAFAAQLAAAGRTRVLGVLRPGDDTDLGALGIDEVVLGDESLARCVRELVPGGVDAVIDAANLGIAAHDALRSQGVFVALVRPFAPPPLRGTRVVVQEVYADGARLAELSALVDAGVLSLRVAAVLALDEAAAAHALVEGGGLRGRVVLVP